MPPIPHNSEKYLRKINFDDLISALIHCLKFNDTEAFKEILGAYIDTHNKTVIARKMHISEATLYWMISKEGNPTLDILASLINTMREAA